DPASVSPGSDPRADGRGLRGRERLLSRLDRRQPRQVLGAVPRARVPDRRVGRHRLRHRLLAGAAGPPPPLADRPDHRLHRRAVHGAQRRGLPAAAAAHRPRQPDRDRGARRLHAADPVPQHHHRPAQRPRGRARRRPRDGADRPPGAVAGRAAAGGAGDPRRPAHRADHHGGAGHAGLLRRRRRPRRADLLLARRHRRHLLQVQRGGGRRPRRPARGDRRPAGARAAALGHPVAAGEHGM
ncbi:MAG: L-proline glycine betaine ABC transport system permease protein ProW, partial [uncultured Solirubrobacteraceae bacterium]